jgi:carbon monoxide dehydrogenase subunit G
MPRVEGTEQLEVPRAVLWRLLNDPTTLASSIPGCRGFERDGEAEHRYRTAIKVAVGAVSGVYEGTVEYVDVAEPERCTIVVAGKGDKGTIDGRGAISLAERGHGTEVGYQGEFKLTGPVAGVGQRMAPGVSRKMIVETLRNLEHHGEAAEPGASRAAPVSGAGPAAEDASAARETVAARSGNAPAPAPAASAETFRPFAVSPGIAFAAGCLVGAAVGAGLVVLL